MIKPRSKAFLEALPKNKNKVIPAAIEAGYATSYALARGKKILNVAVKEAARDLYERTNGTELSSEAAKQLMSEIVGIDAQSLKDRLKYIAMGQDKDFASALKILMPLIAQHGVLLDSDEKNVVVPVLNIVVDKTVNDVVELEHETLDGNEIGLNKAV